MKNIKRFLMVFALVPICFASQAIPADPNLDNLCVEAGYTAMEIKDVELAYKECLEEKVVDGKPKWVFKEGLSQPDLLKCYCLAGQHLKFANANSWVWNSLGGVGIARGPDEWKMHRTHWMEKTNQKCTTGPDTVKITYRTSTGKFYLEVPGEPDRKIEQTVTITAFADSYFGDIHVKDSRQTSITKKCRREVASESEGRKTYNYVADFDYAITNKETHDGIRFELVLPGNKGINVPFKKEKVWKPACWINAADPLIVAKGKSVVVPISVRGLGPLVKCSLDLNGKVGEGEAGVPEDDRGIVDANAAFSTGGMLTATCTGGSSVSASSSPIRVIVEPEGTGPTAGFISGCSCAGNNAVFTAQFENPDKYVLVFSAKVKDLINGKISALKQEIPPTLPSPVKLFVPLPEISPDDKGRPRKYGALFGIGYKVEGMGMRWLDKQKQHLPFKAQDASVEGKGAYDTSEVFICEVDDAIDEEDQDGDGIANLEDNCPSDKNEDQADVDEDGVGDVCDNCPDLPNEDQLDSDEDGFGDACDPCPFGEEVSGYDLDGDGLDDFCDNCPLDWNPEQSDVDEDLVGDLCDNCGLNNPEQEDTDGDGIGDVCEDKLCIPPECCDEYPKPCSDECYEDCPEGYEWDEENCPLCIDVSDREPPVAAILAPASGSTVPPGFTFQVTAFFSDSGEHASGVVSGTFTASGEALASGPSPESFTIEPTSEITKQFSVGVKSDLTGIADRTITITAEGTDAEGNQSSVGSISVIAGGEGQAILLAVSPQDPGPGVTVSVTVTVTNCLPDSTQISYTVAGTDGYSQANTLSVDAQCQAGFTIPGGEAGVSDVVSASIVGSGLSQTVTYVF